MINNINRKIVKARTNLFEIINRSGWKLFLKKAVPFYFQKRLSEKHIEKLIKFPTLFSIEITNYCNAKCWFCPTHKTNRQKGYMEFTLFRKIIDELKPFSDRIKSVALFMDGEPTLHPELIDFLKYSSNAGIKRTYLSSNMEYFTPELTDRIFEANLGSTLQYVMCSLDGANETIYKKNRIGVDFKKAFSNTLYLIDKRNSSKTLYPMIFARLLVSNITADYVDEFKRYWNGKADKVLCYKMHNWGGMINNKSLGLSEKDLEFIPCYFPFSQCAIQFDGTVRLCCVDCNSSIVIGNVIEEAVQNIWKSDSINKIRKSHIMHDFDEMPDICNRCSYPRKGVSVAPFYW